MPKAAGPNVRAISIELTQLRKTEQVAVLNCQIPGRVTPAFPEIACGRCNNIFISSTPTRRFAYHGWGKRSHYYTRISIQKCGQQVGMAGALPAGKRSRSAATTIHEMPVMLVYSSGCACLSHAGLGRT